jgi:hypothetical protein
MTSVQRILPRSGAAWQGTHPAPERSEEITDDQPRRRKPPEKPPEPGTGQMVDRIA